jgi:hypothetical protein
MLIKRREEEVKRRTTTRGLKCLALAVALAVALATPAAPARAAASFCGSATMSLLATLGLTGDGLAASRTTLTEARSVAVEFFRSQNERRYEDTCRLLSRGFYETHGLRDQRTCAAVLRVAFVWSGKIEFRIGKITRDGYRVDVQAVADGAPGRIVLVSESGSLRILAVEGD